MDTTVTGSSGERKSDCTPDLHRTARPDLLVSMATDPQRLPEVSIVTVIERDSDGNLITLTYSTTTIVPRYRRTGQVMI
jgi:hypothetical protein